MSAGRTTLLLAAITVAASLACTGSTDTTGDGLGPGHPEADEPTPTPDPVPRTPRGKHKGGRPGRGGGGGGNELSGAGYGEVWDAACPTCGDGACSRLTVRGATQLDDVRRVERGMDDNVETAWCSKGPGPGEALIVDIPSGCRFHGFSILGGEFDSLDDLKKYSRVDELTVDLDGKRYTAFLDDPLDVPLDKARKFPAFFEVDSSPVARKATFTIERVHEGELRTTCIADLKLFVYPDR